MTEHDALFSEPLLLLAGAVIAASVFRKLGLGTVLGYLVAGIIIGPFLHLVTDAKDIFNVSELGVVFLLFIIGLELKPSRIWQMRRDILGLGLAQVLVTGSVLAAIAWWAGLIDWRGSVVAGFGLALSSTAFALQILADDGDMNTRHGNRSFSILLFQDLAIVPLLALVTILSNRPDVPTDSMVSDLIASVVAVAGMVLAGRYLLTPMFQIIARTGAREVMIAAMEMVGLSMGMGALLAGLMLSESSYRHELEADIEPFRGLFLALFFMAVGMSLHIHIVYEHIVLILIAVPAMMAVKAALIYGLCRIAGSSRYASSRIALLLAQGGEFGFVLFTTAAASGLFPQATASILVAVVTLSMALTPLLAVISRRLTAEDAEEDKLEEDFDGAGADVLMIGFSRFGQIASQILLAGGRDVTVIDSSADRVRQAARFGFRIFFGDGTRKDVLIAAGIERADLVAVCTHKKEVTDRIIDMIQSEFPSVRIYARSYDRVHSLDLRKRGVEYEIRETLESGLLFGRRILEGLDMDGERALAIADDIRERDEQRLELQAVEGLAAGRQMLHNKPVREVKPEPLMKPKTKAEKWEEEEGSEESETEVSL
ncbi:cation:proton antiporter [Agrobacterium sp. LAD9]|uniref:cation:proton antiporter domain-containing protein n=1 Tax=Agrobacterium sp. LAD9 TaxID=2055153 RepID=UPI000D1D5CA1|nr:cation:proton antiporter [Agrobacterium sp. LAD9]